MDCLWPVSVSVQQLLVRAVQEIADGALGNAILEMNIHATEGESLSCIMTGLLEGIVKESPFVTVLVLNPCIVLNGEALEGTFGGDGFFG
jgi:hypothetical protein